MTILVKQKTIYDCGPCCLAMLTGRTLDDVIAAIGDAFVADKGLYSDQKALTRLGFFEADFLNVRRDWCITPNFFKRVAWGRRSLISVPSLNRENVFHMVYFDGRKLFDPSSEKTYTDWNQLMPEELTVFREAA